jgi:prevent-host-death family protein
MTNAEPEYVPTMSIQQAREAFADLVSMAKWQDQAVQITRYGKPVAYIVGTEWYERARRAMEGQTGA